MSAVNNSVRHISKPAQGGGLGIRLFSHSNIPDAALPLSDIPLRSFFVSSSAQHPQRFFRALSFPTQSAIIITVQPQMFGRLLSPQTCWKCQGGRIEAHLMPCFIAMVMCLYPIGLSLQRNPPNVKNMVFWSAVAIDTAFTPVSNDLRESPGRLTSSPLWSDGEQASRMWF